MDGGEYSCVTHHSLDSHIHAEHKPLAPSWCHARSRYTPAAGTRAQRGILMVTRPVLRRQRSPVHWSSHCSRPSSLDDTSHDHHRLRAARLVPLTTTTAAAVRACPSCSARIDAHAREGRTRKGGAARSRVWCCARCLHVPHGVLTMHCFNDFFFLRIGVMC